jgi:small conductance mechanosensitive channel
VLFAPQPTPRPTLPATPACANDAGSWCARVYSWTHNDLLAHSADLVVDRALRILLILVLAVLARALLHRAITRVVERAATGTLRTPGQVAAPDPDSIPRALLSERRAQRARTVGSVLRSITSAVVLVVASIMVMAEFGLDLAPVLASAGIAGVALGFGAQNLVRDFLSGMFMLLEDQYGVGDVVDLGEATGTVESVGLRITTVRDVRGTVWHVRNGAIARVGNKSQGFAVAVVDVPLAHTADIARAVELAGQVSAEVAADEEVARRLLGPPEVLGVETVTLEGVTLRVTAKTQPGQQFAVQRSLNAAITDAFDDERLPRPYGGPLGAPSGAAAAAPANPPAAPTSPVPPNTPPGLDAPAAADPTSRSET